MEAKITYRMRMLAEQVAAAIKNESEHLRYDIELVEKENNKLKQDLHDTKATLNWIIKRIEEESNKGKNSAWKQAASESVEEAYGTLQRLGD